MYTPFLNLSSAYYDLYSYGIGSGAGINGSGVDIRPDPGLLVKAIWFFLALVSLFTSVYNIFYTYVILKSTYM